MGIGFYKGTDETSANGQFADLRGPVVDISTFPRLRHIIIPILSSFAFLFAVKENGILDSNRTHGIPERPGRRGGFVFFR